MRILIIQTAFIGDVVLATPLVEKFKVFYPDCSIDFLLRKGNKNLLSGNPNINKVILFDKNNSKYFKLLSLIREIRENSYDYVINVQRYFTTGLITSLSGAKNKIGFDKNPLSFLFTEKVRHQISNKGFTHEVERNISLISKITDSKFVKPKLYLSDPDLAKTPEKSSYICIAPSSVWFTKQLPLNKWKELINMLPNNYSIYLLGGPSDKLLCEDIKSGFNDKNIVNLSGELSFLESAAYIKNAKITFTNDSAPMHFASAVNAPVVSVFCSTVPEFGFGPLSDVSFIVETNEPLSCRPCGLHGKKECPLEHFNCSNVTFGGVLESLNL